MYSIQEECSVLLPSPVATKYTRESAEASHTYMRATTIRLDKDENELLFLIEELLFADKHCLSTNLLRRSS